LAKQAAEFEASQGIQVAEGVTLFTRRTPQGMAAKPAGVISPRLNVPSGSTPLALPGEVVYGPTGPQVVLPSAYRGDAAADRRLRAEVAANRVHFRCSGGFTDGTISAEIPSTGRVSRGAGVPHPNNSLTSGRDSSLYQMYKPSAACAGPPEMG